MAKKYLPAVCVIVLSIAILNVHTAAAIIIVGPPASSPPGPGEPPVGPPAPYITVTNNNADLTIIPMNGTQPNQSGGERLDIYGNCNGTQSCQLLLSLNCSTPPANDATFFSQDVNNGKGVSHVNMVFFVLGNGVVQINAYVDGVLGKEIWFNNSDGACQLIDINPGL